MICPICKKEQSTRNLECISCGLIFKKHKNFTPVINKITNNDLIEIRKLREGLEDIKANKAEIIAKCKKSNLLDLAAYYLKDPKDKILIKALNNTRYFNLKERFNLRISPIILISSIFFISLIIFIIILRSLL